MTKEEIAKVFTAIVLLWPIDDDADTDFSTIRARLISSIVPFCEVGWSTSRIEMHARMIVQKQKANPGAMTLEFWANEFALIVSSMTVVEAATCLPIASWPSDAVCKGSWPHSACGKCSRCMETAAPTIMQMHEDVMQAEALVDRIGDLMPMRAARVPGAAEVSDEFKVACFNEVRDIVHGRTPGQLAERTRRAMDRK